MKLLTTGGLTSQLRAGGLPSAASQRPWDVALQRGHRQAPPSGTHGTEPTSTARHREHWEGGNDTETATQRSWRGLAA